MKDPLVAPGWHLDVLAKFPPTLLISGTRDIAMSSLIYTHTQLVKAGADADLHLWDGVDHDFFADVDLPESKEAFSVMVKFFARHLGKKPQAGE
jgi:acetyl esterase/lipase